MYTRNYSIRINGVTTIITPSKNHAVSVILKSRTREQTFLTVREIDLVTGKPVNEFFLIAAFDAVEREFYFEQRELSAIGFIP